jgi:uncharacterized protein with PQ loop repeat
MKDEIYIILGYIASGNACLMMLPQVYLTIKNKTMKDLSMNTIYMNLLTQMLFFPYSFHFSLYPLMGVNIMLTLCDVTLILFNCYVIKNEYELEEPLLV